MFKSIFKALAISLAVFSLTYPQMASATSFTGTMFLTWPRESQDSFIQSSITMTGIVATQGRPEIADCIDDWYSDDRAAHVGIHEGIIDTIRKNRDYHPQAVLLAIIQKRCGSFKSEGR